MRGCDYYLLTFGDGLARSYDLGCHGTVEYHRARTTACISSNMLLMSDAIISLSATSSGHLPLLTNSKWKSFSLPHSCPSGNKFAPLHPGRSPTTLTATISGDLSQISLLCAAKVSLRGCDLLFGSFYDNRATLIGPNCSYDKRREYYSPSPMATTLICPSTLDHKHLIATTLVPGPDHTHKEPISFFPPVPHNALYQSLCLQHSPFSWVTFFIVQHIL